MRTLLFIVLSANIFFANSAGLNKSIQVDAPGTLARIINATDVSQITQLTLTGTINASDIYFLRDNMPQLQYIDLSGTKISSALINGILFNDNSLPKDAFNPNTNPVIQTMNNVLSEVRLPLGLKFIGEGAFQFCNALKQVIFPYSFVSFGKGYNFYSCNNIETLVFGPNAKDILVPGTFNSSTSIKNVYALKTSGIGLKTGGINTTFPESANTFNLKIPVGATSNYRNNAELTTNGVIDSSQTEDFELPALPPPDLNNTLTWENYIGHTGWRANNKYQWRRIARHSLFDPAGNSTDYNTALTILNKNHIMYGANTGMPGANDMKDANALPNFMSSIEQSNGKVLYDKTLSEARSLVNARILGWGKAKIYWQLGNEVNNSVYSDNIKAWATTNSKPYPHPASPGGGSNSGGSGDDDVTTSTDQGYIGYMMEYSVGPMIEAINAINASLPDSSKIILLSGSLANSRNPDNRLWMSSMLNYTFQGTYAPTLTGKKYCELIEGVTHHYLFAEYRNLPDPGNGLHSRQEVLKNMYDVWTDGGIPNNHVKYIFTTEEMGNKAINAGKAAYLSVVVSFSYIDFWLKYGFSPEFGKVMHYGVEGTTGGTNSTFVSTTFSMNLIEQIIPNRVLTRSPEMVASNPALEQYVFSTNQNEIFMVIHTPRPSTDLYPAPQNLSNIVLNLPDGTNYEPVLGASQLFTIDEYVKPRINVVSKTGNRLELVVNVTTDRTNGSLTVQNGILTKFNGTLVFKLVRK